MEEKQAPGSEELPKSTLPANLPVAVRSFNADVDHAALANRIGRLLGELGRVIDLSGLDGLTLADDYDQALLSLDRGFDTTHRLTPSRSHAVGVAMTPSVLRNGAVKSHIVLCAPVFLDLLDSDGFGQAIHLLAHECAHVEVTHYFDRAFPGVLLREPVDTIRQSIRSETTFACWEEYAACMRSARIGTNPGDGYEETFKSYLQEARPRANAAVRAFHSDGNVDRVLLEVSATCGDLLKFSAYCLGNLAGLGTRWESTGLAEVLEGHWYAPYFAKLDKACSEIAQEYGAWQDRDVFYRFGTLVEELIAECGVLMDTMPDGRIYVQVQDEDRLADGNGPAMFI